MLNRPFVPLVHLPAHAVAHGKMCALCNAVSYFICMMILDPQKRVFDGLMSTLLSKCPIFVIKC